MGLFGRRKTIQPEPEPEPLGAPGAEESVRLPPVPGAEPAPAAAAEVQGGGGAQPPPRSPSPPEEPFHGRGRTHTVRAGELDLSSTAGLREKLGPITILEPPPFAPPSPASALHTQDLAKWRRSTVAGAGTTAGESGFIGMQIPEGDGDDEVAAAVEEMGHHQEPIDWETQAFECAGCENPCFNGLWVVDSAQPQVCGQPHYINRFGFHIFFTDAVEAWVIDTDCVPAEITSSEHVCIAIYLCDPGDDGELQPHELALPIGAHSWSYYHVFESGKRPPSARRPPSREEWRAGTPSSAGGRSAGSAEEPEGWRMRELTLSARKRPPPLGRLERYAAAPMPRPSAIEVAEHALRMLAPTPAPRLTPTPPAPSEEDTGGGGGGGGGGNDDGAPGSSRAGDAAGLAAAAHRLQWLAEEALCAPLPAGWAEHLDPIVHGGGWYFFRELDSGGGGGAAAETWDHPLIGSYTTLAASLREASDAVVAACLPGEEDPAARDAAAGRYAAALATHDALIRPLLEAESRGARRARALRYTPGVHAVRAALGTRVLPLPPPTPLSCALLPRAAPVRYPRQGLDGRTQQLLPLDAGEFRLADRRIAARTRRRRKQAVTRAAGGDGGGSQDPSKLLPVTTMPHATVEGRVVAEEVDTVWTPGGWGLHYPRRERARARLRVEGHTDAEVWVIERELLQLSRPALALRGWRARGQRVHEPRLRVRAQIPPAAAAMSAALATARLTKAAATGAGGGDAGGHTEADLLRGLAHIQSGAGRPSPRVHRMRVAFPADHGRPTGDDRISLATAQRVAEQRQAALHLTRHERGQGLLQPLHLAARRGEQARVAALLRELPRLEQLDARNFAGQTALHEAAMAGHTAVVRALVEAGCSLEPRDRFGHTPLHLSARWGRRDVLQLLIDRGALIDPHAKRYVASMYVSGMDAIERAAYIRAICLVQGQWRYKVFRRWLAGWRAAVIAVQNRQRLRLARRSWARSRGLALAAQRLYRGWKGRRRAAREVLRLAQPRLLATWASFCAEQRRDAVCFLYRLGECPCRTTQRCIANGGAPHGGGNEPKREECLHFLRQPPVQKLLANCGGLIRAMDDEYRQVADPDGTRVGQGTKARTELMLDAQAKFAALDADSSGFLDAEELAQLLKELGRHVTDKAVARALADMDEDGNGEVSFEEFEAWWKQQEQIFLPEEDEALRALVEAEGPGNWANKAMRFPSQGVAGKSAAALRARWEGVLSRSEQSRMSGLDRKQQEVLHEKQRLQDEAAQQRMAEQVRDVET
jgi:hypothetical protein